MEWRVEDGAAWGRAWVILIVDKGRGESLGWSGECWEGGRGEIGRAHV